jgi:hypothetical protein
MNNSAIESHKPFAADATKANIEKETTKQPIKTTTLPSIVTICLAGCGICTGDYIDVTVSFRLRCCPCHNKYGGV